VRRMMRSRQQWREEARSAPAESDSGRGGAAGTVRE